MTWNKDCRRTRLEERRRARQAVRQYYTCEVCAATYLHYDGRAAYCRAGLCKVCYDLRAHTLHCECPRLRGDKASVYACKMCPELVADPAAVKRLVQAAWDNLVKSPYYNPERVPRGRVQLN